MSRQEKTKFITKDILGSSIKGAFVKLNPMYMMKNPVMFVVDLSFVLFLSFSHIYLMIREII